MRPAANGAVRERNEAEWIRGASEDAQALRYLDALRKGVPYIVLTVVVCVACALLLLSRAEKVYEAGADVLVSSTLGRDADVVGLNVLGSSLDPTRTVETAARLMTAPEVANRVRRQLRLRMSADQLRKSVEAVPVATSDVVTLTARASSADEARRLADGFVRAAVAERTEQLHAQLDELIPRLQVQLDRTQDPDVRRSLSGRLADLETLREGPDRTLRPASLAELPTSPVSPRPRLSVFVAVLVGLLLGIGAVIMRELLSPRVWREGQLRARFAVPVLARVPGGGGVAGLRGPMRTLRASVTAAGGNDVGAPCIMVTSPASNVGRSVVARELARSLAEAGKWVLLVEPAPRTSVKAATDAEPGLLDVVNGQVPLHDAVVHPDDQREQLSLLLMDDSDTTLDEQQARQFLRGARDVADWVVLAAPAGRVFDEMALTREAQQLVIVVRLGSTKVTELQTFAEALAGHHVVPAGFVVLNAGRDRS